MHKGGSMGARGAARLGRLNSCACSNKRLPPRLLLHLGRLLHSHGTDCAPAGLILRPQPLIQPAMASQGEVLPAEGGFKVREGAR